MTPVYVSAFLLALVGIALLLTRCVLLTAATIAATLTAKILQYILTACALVLLVAWALTPDRRDDHDL